jgi:hypothetical protein
LLLVPNEVYVVPERFNSINLKVFYGTYGLKVFIGAHVTSSRLSIGSMVGEKGLHWSEVGVLGDQIAFAVSRYSNYFGL